MKPYVHRERNWASLDECKYIINELGPKTYIYSDNKGKPFDYKAYFFNGEEILKFLPNFITTPSKILSEIKVLDPAPIVKIFSLLSSNSKNLTKSFKFSAL